MSIILRLPTTFHELEPFCLALEKGLINTSLRLETTQKKYEMVKKEDRDKFTTMVKNKLKITDYVITENAYPYDLLFSQICPNEPKIDHLIFWSNVSSPYKSFSFKKYYRYFSFENPQKNKSIPEIRHWHIFAQQMS